VRFNSRLNFSRRRSILLSRRGVATTLVANVARRCARPRRDVRRRPVAGVAVRHP
jgi:hypothetical protein